MSGSGEGVTYSDRDFENGGNLKGSIIPVPTRFNPLTYHVIRDSFVLITYWDADDYLVDLVNFKRGQLIRKLAKAGSDSTLFSSARIRYVSPLDNYFTVYDVVKNRLTKFNIDSVLLEEGYNGVGYNIPSFAGDMTFYQNDSILIFNKYYFNIKDSILNSNNSSPLLFISKEYTRNQILNIEYERTPQFFTFNATGSDIYVNPKSQDIWLVDNAFDKITIFDSKFLAKKQLLGPDVFDIKYELRPDSSVHTFMAKYYRSFYPGVFTGDHVYMMYLGIQGIDLNKSNIERPVCILKYRWDGSPVKKYKINEFLYNLSIVSGETAIYGTTAKKFGDSAKLIKYIIE